MMLRRWSWGANPAMQSRDSQHTKNIYNIQLIYLVIIVLLKICGIPLSWLLHGMENLVTLLSNYEVCMNGNVCERKNSGKLLRWKLFINFPCKMSTKTPSETPFLEMCSEEASLDLAPKAHNFRPICTGEIYLLKSYFLPLATLHSSSSSVNDFQSSQKSSLMQKCRIFYNDLK